MDITAQPYTQSGRVKISSPEVHATLLEIAACWAMMIGNQTEVNMLGDYCDDMRGARVMVAKLHLQHEAPYQRRRPPLSTWQRVIVGGALLVAMLLSTALIYFQPGTCTLIYRDTTRPTSMAETAPALPPGTDSYYFWGQWKPLDQQP
jgi:hypothetical protein